MDPFKINPFISRQAQLMPIMPVAPQFAPPVAGVSTPIRRQEEFSFGHLTGLSGKGPGSLLQTNPGEVGLGDRAIKLADNNEAGRNLYLQA